jgi:hypothetical protein
MDDTFKVIFSDRWFGPSSISPFSNAIYSFTGTRYKPGVVYEFAEKDRYIIEELIASDTLGAARGTPIAKILDDEDAILASKKDQKAKALSLADAAAAEFGVEGTDVSGLQIQMQNKAKAKLDIAALRNEVLGR